MCVAGGGGVLHIVGDVSFMFLAKCLVHSKCSITCE